MKYPKNVGMIEFVKTSWMFKFLIFLLTFHSILAFAKRMKYFQIVGTVVSK